MLLKLLPSPVIIIGMHRSGTTMLAQLLENAGIYMGGDYTAYYESNYFQKINNRLLLSIDSSWDYPKPSVAAPDFSYRSLITEYAAFYSEPYSIISLLLQKSWGWKDPRNTFTLESWLQLFPHAKVVHIVRNGIDAAISLYERNISMRDEGEEWFSPRLTTPEACFDLWEQYVNEGLKWQEKLGSRYHEVRYEGMVNHSKQSIYSLENYLSIKLKEQNLHLIKNTDKNKKALPVYASLKNYAEKNPTFIKLNYVNK